MRSLKTAILIGALAALVAIPARSHAQDLRVYYNYRDSEARIGFTIGAITVSVHNLTGDAVHNVDLRLDASSPNTVEHGLLQFGSIPHAEVRVANGRYVFDTEAPPREPLFWKVEYDDAGGHHALVIEGTEITP